MEPEIDYFRLYDRIRQAYEDKEKTHEDIMAMYAAVPDKGAYIEGNSDKTFIHIAVSYADTEALEYLLANGAKATVKTQSNLTLLHFLADGPFNRYHERKDEDIYKTVDILMSNRVSPLIRAEGAGGDLCYHTALKGSQACLPFIYAMMQHKVKLNMLDRDGANVLHLLVRWPANYAARTIVRPNYPEDVPKAYKMLDDCFELAKALMDYGIDPDVKMSEGRTAADVASEHGLGKLAILLKGEYDESDPRLDDLIASKGKSLHQAVYDNDLPALEALIRLGADINEIYNGDRSEFKNQTPLSIACIWLRVDCIQKLIEAGADPNARGGEEDETVFYYFARKSRMRDTNDKTRIAVQKTVNMLLDAGLDPDKPVDKKGNTALNFLCTRFAGELEEDIRGALLDAGVGDYNIPDLAGVTPLMNLVSGESRYNENHLITLLEFGADMSLKDSKSNTALIYAAKNRSSSKALSAADLMFSFGDPMPAAVNNEGKSALDYAVKEGNESLVKLLLSKM